MFKRIFWFLTVNIAVLSLISLILSFFNTQNYFAANCDFLLVLPAIIGFAESFISFKNAIFGHLTKILIIGTFYTRLIYSKMQYGF